MQAKEDHRASTAMSSQHPLTSQQNPTKPISSDVGYKSTQTNETSFVPCESCAKIQTNVKANADQLINMCHYQDIQSQVGKYRASLMSSQLIGGWLSGPELERWLQEQDKDLARVAKQLEFMSKNSQMLKAKLAESEVSMGKAQQSERELKKAVREEKEATGTLMRQYERKLSDQRSELEASVKGLQAEVKSLSDLKTSLDQKYENLKNLHENNEKIIVELSKCCVEPTCRART